MSFFAVLFETKILFFRAFTLFFIAAMVYILFRKLSGRYGKTNGLSYAIFWTSYFYLMHEWTWQIGTWLKWRVLTPTPQWIDYQAVWRGLPIWNPNNFVYLSTFVVVIFGLWNTRRDVSGHTFVVCPVVMLLYQIAFNLLSPNVVYNDYNFSVIMESFGNQQKMFVLLPEYFGIKIVMTFFVHFSFQFKKLTTPKPKSLLWREYWKNNPLWRRVGAKILNHIQLASMPVVNSSVLEVGCGTSRNQKYRGKWVGLDKEKITNPSIVGVVEHLPFKNKTFSLVFSFGLLEHLLNPQQALREMERVGGTVYFTIPCKNGVIHFLHRVYTRLGRQWIFPREVYYEPKDFPTYTRITRIFKTVDIYKKRGSQNGE